MEEQNSIAGGGGAANVHIKGLRRPERATSDSSGKAQREGVVTLRCTGAGVYWICSAGTEFLLQLWKRTEALSSFRRGREGSEGATPSLAGQQAGVRLSVFTCAAALVA